MKNAEYIAETESMPTGYAEARNIVFHTVAPFARCLVSQMKRNVTRTIKMMEETAYAIR